MTSDVVLEWLRMVGSATSACIDIDTGFERGVAASKDVLWEDSDVAIILHWCGVSKHLLQRLQATMLIR